MNSFVNREKLAGRAKKPGRKVLLSIACVLFAIALTSPAVFSQAKVGTTGAQFLELGVSSRAMAMGEAYTAVVDDISAVYYNPAALTSLYGREATFTYVSMPADVGFGFAAIGLPLESIGGVIGIAAYSLSSGDIIETTYGSGVISPTIRGTGRTFKWEDVALSFSYGRYLTDRFSIGFTVKFLQETAAIFTSNGWAADVGTLYDTGFRGFKIGMVITNFGGDMRFERVDYPLPINFKFGASINVVEKVDHFVTFAAEGWHPSDNLEKYNAGLEYTFKDMVALRAGGRFNYDIDGLTAGGGLRLPFNEDQEIRIDYAYQDFGILTEVHRFTLSFAF